MNKIETSGAYRDLTMAEYHGACTVGVSVSSTTLRQAELFSMRHAWLASHLNPDRDDAGAAHFRLGTALHSLAFEGELSPMHFAISPYKTFQTNEAKAWRDRRANEGKTILKPDDVKKVRMMLDELVKEPIIKSGLFDERGELETSVIHKDEETGLFVKVRPDVIATNTIMVDLKSCQDARVRAVRRSIDDYAYHMQLALVDEVLGKVLGLKFDAWAFVFIEKELPFCVTVAEVSADYIAWGKVQNRRALRRFADCVSKGVDKEHFPKYEHGEIVVGPPPWLVERLTKEQEQNMLPQFAEVGYHTA